MDYGKRQTKKTLEQIKHPELKNKKAKNKPKRSNWEIRQEQSKKKRQTEKHKEYTLRRKKKIQRSEKSSKFAKVDNSIYHIASQHDGFINTHKLQQELSNDYLRYIHMMSPFYFFEDTYRIYWLDYHNKKRSSYIKSYSKTISNKIVRSFDNMLHDFMDSRDIKLDLGLNSIKNANRILKPVTKTKPTPEHLPANELFKVFHITQFKYIKNPNGKGLKRITRKYGINKPVTVVSKKDYLKFIKFSYKKNHINHKYAKRHFSPFGQKLYNLYTKSKPQQKAIMFMNLATQKILDDTILEETKIFNKYHEKIESKYISNPTLTNFILSNEPYPPALLQFDCSKYLKLLIFNTVGKTEPNKTDIQKEKQSSNSYKSLLKHGKQELKKLNNLIKH